MPSTTKELTVFRPGVLIAAPAVCEIPVYLDPGALLVFNASSNPMWVDPGRWRDMPVITGKRASVAKRPVAAVIAKVGGVFAAGFTSALLYSAEPVERDVIRIMLPPPSSTVPKGLQARPFVTAVFPTVKERPRRAAAALVPLTEHANAVLPRLGPIVEISAPPPIVDLAAIRSASNLAIKTEIAQPWQASGLHGYAVAGPVTFAGSGACRIVAVWIEARGVPGKSVSTRYCLSAAGKWQRGTVAPESPGTPDKEEASYSPV